MAGLIGLTASDIEIQDALRVPRWAYDGAWEPHPLVRLTTTLPVAVRDEEGPVVSRVRWGFPVGGGRPIGNARDDRLDTSRMWSALLGASHGVFAATGIYEMAEMGGRKTALWFRRRDGEPILMPGLVGPRNVDGRKTVCGAIITTQPNVFFGRFHDRQVCTLAPEDVGAWLQADADAARRMLHTAEPDEWEAVPVDRRIFGQGRREMKDLCPIAPPLRHGDAGPAAPTLHDF